MYRIAILGCENSHAKYFCEYALNSGKFNDVEIVGVFSEDPEAGKKLNEQFGVYSAKSYDEFVGKIDGLMITARHGDDHYRFAKPYIKAGIPMFIDKPITISETEAVEFMKELKENNVRITGGSCCVYDSYVQYLKNAVEKERFGKVFGGFVRAPLGYNEQYGGFFFYSQHLVQVMCEIFGCYPKTVSMFEKKGHYTAVVGYDDYNITCEFTDNCYVYYAGVSAEKGFYGDAYPIDTSCFNTEFDEFYKLLKGEEQKHTYKDFIAPIFIMNAMDRSIKSNKAETINEIEEI